MRASSSEQLSRKELPRGVRELRQQDSVDNRTLYERLAEHQPKEFQSAYMDKCLTPNKKLLEYSRQIKNFSPVIANTESPNNEKQNYGGPLQISPKEIIQGRSAQSDQQTRFETIVKGQKLRMNELEIKNLKLSKELSSYKYSPNKDLSTINEKDSQIIFENQKRITESEELNKYLTHETVKQNIKERVRNISGLLKDSDGKLEMYEKELNTLYNQAIKDDDEFTFKGDFIKILQDLVQDKEKTFEDLKNSNERFLKMLEEKDEKVDCLENDLAKEREQMKLLGGQLSGANTQKSPDRRVSEKPSLPEKKFQSAKIIKHKPEINSFKGPLSKSPSKAKTSMIKPVGDGYYVRLQNQSIDLELKINNLTRENLQLKRYILNLDEKCQGLQDDVKSYRSLLLRNSKDSTPKSRNEIKGSQTEINSKLAQVLKEKEKLERFYKDLELEYEVKVKKLVELEQQNKAINEREYKISAGLIQENDGLKIRLENEIKHSDKTSKFISDLSRKLGLIATHSDLNAMAKELDGKIDELMQFGTRAQLLSQKDQSDEILHITEEKDSIIKTLEQNLIQLESQVHKLGDTNLKTSEQVDKLTKENLSLNHHLGQIIELLNPENPNSLESLQASIKAHKASIEKGGLDIENLEIQISQNLKECIQHKTETEDLNEKLQTAKVDNLRLAERITELENENQDLNEFVDDENMQSIEDSVIEGKDAEIKALKDEIISETKELDIVKSLLNEKQIECEKNIELQQSLSKVRIDCQEKETKIKLLEMQKKKLMIENEDLKNDVKCLKDDNFALHKSRDLDVVNSLEEENEVMRERIDELEKDLSKRMEATAGLTAKIEILEIGIIDKNQSQDKESRDLIDKIKSLENQLSDKHSEIIILSQELNKAQNNSSTPYYNLSSQSEENIKLEDETCIGIPPPSHKSQHSEALQNSAFASKNDLNLEIRIKKLNEDLKEKESKLKLAEALQKNLRNENQEIEEDLKLIRNENFELTRRIEQTESKIEEYCQKIKELEDNELIFENERKKFRGIEEELKQQNRDLIDRLQDLNEEISRTIVNEPKPDSEAFKTLENTISKLNQELLSKQARIISLEADKRRFVKDAEEMEGDLKDLRIQNFDLIRNAGSMNKDFETEQLRTLNIKLEENEIVLITKLNELKGKEREMREYIIGTEGKLNDLQSVLALRDEKIESQLLELQGLNLRVKELTEEFEKLGNQTNEKSEFKQEKAFLSSSEESKLNLIEPESNIKDLASKVNELEKNLKLKEIKIKALEADKRISENEMKENEILMKQIRAENFDLHRRLNE